MIRQALILAGGRGERLKPFTDEAPKPLYPINGRPFVYYLIDQLKDSGVKEIVFLLGYMAEKMKLEVLAYPYADRPKFVFGVTPEKYDTGARIRDVEDILDDEFMLLYCDNYCPIDLKTAYEQFQSSCASIQVSAYSNKDSYTKNNLLTNDGFISIYDKKRQIVGLNAVDIGYAFIRKETIRYLPDDNVNFEGYVYPQVVSLDKMGCYLTDHRYYSIGSWERMKLTEEFFRERKVIFLDRDGTLNVRPPKACYVTAPDEFVWLKKAKEAVKYLKDIGYEIYLISNQSGIARGEMTEQDLERIHDKMLRELREIGADIDGIYYCPHGWDDGCECRKPRPGMLYRAQREHSLNLPQCILIGDDERDIETGNNAGLKKSILITEQYSLWDAVHDLESE